MQVHVKLMGALRARLPQGQAGKAALDCPAQASVSDVLGRLGIGAGQVHLVMVNNAMEPDRQRALRDGDVLTVFPPVAGG